jgi:eukaryotic-like serine/threonine-protein kinase
MEKGQTIAGKYRLNRSLGTGGMATVWSATNVFTEREFAVKFLLPHVASTPEAARRFLLEAKVSARINHPNIIEVIDVGQTDEGALFLVMELLQGISLEAAIRRQKPAMKVSEFLHIMADVAQALAAAHRNGVIHRDLKPSNVFLHRDRDGQTLPKVLDFGVSKFIDEDGAGAMTTVGTILGSPLYMSPEQAIGAEGIDGRTDVFAFGAILFEALCGERAYSALNLNALIVAIATTQPRRIEECAPTLPQPLKDLVDACMVTDKTRRLASFDAVAERLAPLTALLADSDLRLPSPRRAAAEGTPVGDARGKRTSDRPTPMSGSGASVPPLSMPAPSALPPKGSATIPGSLSWPAARETLSGRRSRAITWAAGAGALLLLSLLIAFSGFGHGKAASRVAAASSDVTPTQFPSPEPTAQPPPSSDERNVPVIAVDQLPMAAVGRPTSKNGGRLSVAATPGSCSIFVDGTPHGVTPLHGFEVASGSHRVDCVPTIGNAKATTVTVRDGAEAHYQFTLAQ